MSLFGCATRRMAPLGVAFLWAAAALSPAGAQDKPLTKARIVAATAVLDVTYPQLTLPLTLGYWKDEGLDVEVVPGGGSLQAVQQLVVKYLVAVGVFAVGKPHRAVEIALDAVPATRSIATLMGVGVRDDG